ncbi:hypothetical protein BLNAU_7258 [Blattamonas nauphoetae]|uniref:Right handed beta helix domain-containing protein n=1 Tax=Blattamonas nauphoetae TaxID=2049346 RepID=A0ABQ9Y263_9EUKA|nr:hypothetical protein BLNAU_7258 [Blattamonas nauphoetae]
MKLSSSIIEGPADTIDPLLTLVVDNSIFFGITIVAQKPVLAGPEVQNVNIMNSTFQDITCSENHTLPTETVQGVANRSVVMKSSLVDKVDGALSGALVFGLQATDLTLKDVHYYRGTNAVRFSNNVVFSSSIKIEIISSEFQNTTTSDFWPNGGILYLPHDEVHINMFNTSVSNSSAPNGHGGFLFTSGHSTIIFDRCRMSYTSAGKSGGFIWAGKNVDTVILDNIDVRHSYSFGDGGALFLDGVRSFQSNFGVFSTSSTLKQGGVAFFNNSDDSEINRPSTKPPTNFELNINHFPHGDITDGVEGDDTQSPYASSRTSLRQHRRRLPNSLAMTLKRLPQHKWE